MATTMQIAFYVLVFLFIFAIDESMGGPQMCNQFTSCNVNITVCKTKCNQRHRGGIGFCAVTGTAPAPSPPSTTTEGLLDLPQLAKAKPELYCRVCNCKYKAKKCLVEKPPPVC